MKEHRSNVYIVLYINERKGDGAEKVEGGADIDRASE